MEKQKTVHKAITLQREIVYKHAAPQASMRGMDIVERNGSVLACRKRDGIVRHDDNQKEPMASVQVLAESDNT